MSAGYAPAVVTLLRTRCKWSAAYSAAAVMLIHSHQTLISQDTIQSLFAKSVSTCHRLPLQCANHVTTGEANVHCRPLIKLNRSA